MPVEAEKTKSSGRRVEEAAIRPPCEIDARAVISDKAQLIGTHKITIGANAVVHPYAKLDSTSGPVTIGEYCIVFERAVVGVSEQSASATEGVTLGASVCINSRAKVEAKSVGNGTSVEVCGTLCAGSVVGEFCKIKPAETLESGRQLPDFTILYGMGQQRIDQTLQRETDNQQAILKEQAMQVELLRQLIPSNIAKWTM